MKFDVEKTNHWLGFVVNIGAIFGMIAAVVAFFYPATVVDYFAEAMREAQKANESLDAIESSSASTAVSSAETASNTELLALDVGTFGSVESAEVKLYQVEPYVALQVVYVNNSNVPIEKIKMTLFDGNGNFISEGSTPVILGQEGTLFGVQLNAEDEEQYLSEYYHPGDWLGLLNNSSVSLCVEGIDATGKPRFQKYTYQTTVAADRFDLAVGQLIGFDDSNQPIAECSR